MLWSPVGHMAWETWPLKLHIENQLLKRECYQRAFVLLLLLLLLMHW